MLRIKIPLRTTSIMPLEKVVPIRRPSLATRKIIQFFDTLFLAQNLKKIDGIIVNTDN